MSSGHFLSENLTHGTASGVGINEAENMEISNRQYDRVHRKFLVEQELAERWNKSRRMLQRMRADGSGPAYHRIGGSVLYKIDDIEAFEAASRIGGKA